MSSLRPGTVDYSHFDNIDYSSSESEDEDDESSARASADSMEDDDVDSIASSSSYESDGSSYESDERSAVAPLRRPQVVPRPPQPRRAPPLPSLATLQRAWGSNTATDENGEPVKACAACLSLNPRFRCGRCKLVWYCGADCQRGFHPIHRLECVDANKHKMFWGILNDNSTQEQSNTSTQLVARQMAKRRRALKRAAAAAAIERARLARLARGTETKGGGNAKKGQDEKEETCAVCQCEFTVSGDAGVSLCCPSSHFMCFECSGVYVKSVLGDLETSYPPKCPMCRTDFPMDHFERQLTKQQQVEIKTFAAKQALQPGQELVKCNECHYFKVTSESPIVWWCEACGHGVCFVCNKELPRNAQKYDLTTSPHAICKELASSKKIVEEAIEAGSKMKCPGCGLAGRKDDACTHMNCPKCTTVWCYVCGLDVKECDKAPPRDGRPADDIFLHNHGWETNELRCPMYLTQILEVDLHWLGENWEETAEDADFEDDEKCLDHFHRFQTIRKLQEARATVGPDDFAAVFSNFDSIKNSGYTLEEIISTSTDALIDREEYLQFRIDHGEDEEHIVGDAEQQQEEADDSMEGEEEVWEEVPNEMTHAVVLEESQIAQAIEASRASADEDEQLRQVMLETSNNASNE